ncbi:hypothetical protein PFISCL1PPCAC_212, partial [Pristionchus fissidentatus]
LSSTFRVTPTVSEREIIALLLIAGEQFDEIKWGILSDYDAREITVYGAIALLEMYLERSQFVSPSKWPEMYKIVEVNKIRMEKLVESIGRRKIELYNNESELTLFKAGAKYRMTNCLTFNSILLNTARNPMKTTEKSIVKKAIEVLIQPNLKEVVIESKRGRKTAEDPCLSLRPKIRPARKRRFSLVNSVDFDEKKFNSKDLRELAHEIEDEANKYILNDTCYKEYEEPSYVTCCRQRVSMKERWVCSSALREEGTHEGAHAECLQTCVDKDVSCFALATWKEGIIPPREFGFLDSRRTAVRKCI